MTRTFHSNSAHTVRGLRREAKYDLKLSFTALQAVWPAWGPSPRRIVPSRIIALGSAADYSRSDPRSLARENNYIRRD